MKFFDLEISETILSEQGPGIPQLPSISYEKLINTSIGIQCTKAINRPKRSNRK